jgi:outer membrane protein TolC
MRSLCLLTVGVLLLSAPFGLTEDLTLDTVLKRTVEKNPEIVNAKLELERAYGRRLVFRSVGYPNVMVGIAAGDQGGSRAGEKPNQPFGFAYGGITQPVFNLAVPASFRRGDVEVLIAQQRLNMAVSGNLHAARVTFCTGIYNRALKELREEQQKRLLEIEDSQKARYESGLTDRGSFIGAGMQTRELNPRIETAERGYQGSLLQEAELMGDDLSAAGILPRMQGQLTYSPVHLDVDAAAAAALQSRADLKLARLMVRAAKEDQRIIEAGYYPAINAVVAGEYIPVSGVRRQTEGSPHRSDDVISSEIRLGGTYSWRVIDNGLVYGAVLRQKSIRAINQLTVQKMEADVPRELARIRNNLDAIAMKQAQLSAATSAAELTAATVQENLAGGVTSQLEYRLAENASLKVKTALLDLAYQQSLALAEWDRVTGHYFQFSEDQRTKNVP